MDDLDDEILQLFVAESREHLDGIQDDLLAMEAMESLDKDLVNQVFRTLHSIKGGAGFFDLNNLQNLAHSMENVLDKIRNAELVTSSAIVSALLSGADTVASMVDNLATSNEVDITDHLTVLDEILKSDETPGSEGSSSKEEPVEQVAEENISNEDSIPESEKNIAVTENIKADVTVVIDEKSPAVDEPPQPLATKSKTNKKEKPGRTPGSPGGDQSIRVHLTLLDQLMELAGELVLARNALLQSVETGDPALLLPASKKIDSITSQLQRAIMSTRMQTIEIVFSKFRRIVRDLSGQLGKQIKLDIVGEEVELDKTIIEALGDPLTHLVRNAIDHALETPTERRIADKPTEGTLRLHAFHEAGQVVIEVTDDGAGINPEKIGAKALEKGLVSVEELARMNEKDIVRLIFQPGFSTVEEVTDISGRGVGMDVVRQNLAKVGGVADIESTLGVGTTIRIKLPLTLAIIPSVLVGISAENFAIPQVNVVEMVGIAPDEIKSRIQYIGGVAMLHLRGELVPLIELSDLFDIEQSYIDQVAGNENRERRNRFADRRQLEENTEPETPDIRISPERRTCALSFVNIVIVTAGAFKYGIRVDELHESAEIVVKPLGRHFSDSNEFSGATILGDGTVALILDVEGIRLLSGACESRQLEPSIHSANQIQDIPEDSFSVLIINHAENEMYGVPLQLVTRIEKFSLSELQDVGNCKAISYRDGILPLLSLDASVSTRPMEIIDDQFYVIIFMVGTNEMGLMVSDIKDFINYQEEIDSKTHKRPGVNGSMLVNGEIVQLLDLFGLLELDDPKWTMHLTSNDEEALSILVVEDSPFFQAQMASTVEAAGYSVITADDGLQGLDALRSHPEISMIVTDIEMPNMDGLEMVRSIRKNPEFEGLPIVAVTSLAGEAAEKRGLAAGVDEYQVKLDREQLVESCRRLAKPRKILSGMRG